MQITYDTRIFLVSLLPGEDGHITEMVLQRVFDAVKGGMSASDNKIFVGPDAKSEATAFSGRLKTLQQGQRLLEQMTNKELLHSVQSMQQLAAVAPHVPDEDHGGTAWREPDEDFGTRDELGTSRDD